MYNTNYEYSPLHSDSATPGRNSRIADTGETGAGSSGTSTESGKVSNSHRRIAQRPVIHPIFESAQDYTLDNFWKFKLMQAARGKFPSGFCYRDGFLIQRGKNKSTTVSISRDPQQAMRAFIAFMKEAGIYSDGDVNMQQDNLMFRRSIVTSISSWTEVPIKMREGMLEDYIKREILRLALNERDARTLRLSLILGVRMKIFKAARIRMVNQAIDSVDGLVRNPDGSFEIRADLWNAALNKLLQETSHHVPGQDVPSAPLICHTSDSVKKSKAKQAEESANAEAQQHQTESSENGVQSSTNNPYSAS